MSKLGAFDQSKLLAFVESELSARGLPAVASCDLSSILVDLASTYGCFPGPYTPCARQDFQLTYSPARAVWSRSEYEGVTLTGETSGATAITGTLGGFNCLPNPANPNTIYAQCCPTSVTFPWEGIVYSVSAGALTAVTWLTRTPASLGFANGEKFSGWPCE
jgi:hypothetical protein